MRTGTLIVGQGLAGSLLAWELMARGKRVFVVDRDEPVTSSKIAAGIVTPITGKRLAPSWRIDEMLDRANRFYRHVENETGRWLFRPAAIARLLANQTESERWRKRLAENGGKFPEHAGPLEIDDEWFNRNYGGFEMRGAGWLDVPAFLEATRQQLLERASYAIAEVESDAITVGEESLKWKSVEADRVVFCQGWEGNRNRWFDWIEYRHAKGEILDLELHEPAIGSEQRIINREGWLLPAGEPGENRWRAGSTYEWDFSPDEATETSVEKQEEIARKIGAMFRRPVAFKVTGHRAGVRPIIRESRGLIGVHPSLELHGRVAFFNGLGSKGVLNGPFLAHQLAEHLVNGAPIEEEVDLRRNL